MNRTPDRSSRGPKSGASDLTNQTAQEMNGSASNGGGSWWDLLLFRAVFVVAFVAACYHFHPFGLLPFAAAGAGLALSLVVFFIEQRLRRVSLRRLIGASVGSILGILGAYLMHLVLQHTSIPESSRSFLGVAVVLAMTYIGLVIGANKGDMLNLQAFGGVFGSEHSTRRFYKIFDTSVIIDGRVADICEANFLDGTLLMPQFVLRELQLVADSADPLKRQRGRRGLEVLQRIQKMPHIEVEIVEYDFANIQEVDLKLIELAKRYEAKIVTNDYNLNKVARLHGVDVINLNDLANSLKPVFLPGESLEVLIVKPGEEQGQGVGYLDDGTMIVVEGGREHVGKTVKISVTSVLQTSAGRMIFGRAEGRADGPVRR
jgi:uncharacterized protein YacL